MINRAWRGCRTGFSPGAAVATIFAMCLLAILTLSPLAILTVFPLAVFPVARAAPAASSTPSASELLSADQLTAAINRVLAASWERTKIEPAAPADDAEFLRRVYLDLVGKIPAVADLEEFRADSRPNKRGRLIEELLSSGAHSQHFANTWRGLMLAGAPENVGANLLVPQFETWLRLRFAINMPYDRLVTELLTANVEPPRPAAARNVRSSEPSPAAFFQANEQKAEQIAAATTRIFLGVQVQCAQCHDHPFSHWTRKEFWSLTAFFDRPAAMGQPPMPKPTTGSVNAIFIPETQIVVEPAFLDGSQPDWNAAVGNSSMGKRDLLSRWITQADNPFFARAAVNRLWDHFMGRGFVQPVDDLDKANPPVHPELLDLLARQLTAHRYDLNYLIRAITATRAYQLSSSASPSPPTPLPQGERGVGSGGVGDLGQFARMPLRRMTADQLFASIVQATGFREVASAARRNGQPDVMSAAAEFRNQFADQAVPRTEAETSILQALALMNGKLVSDATDLAKSETLLAVAEAPFLQTEGRIEVLFAAALSRKPARDELAECVAYVDRGGAQKNTKQALADVFWALLDSAEFSLNH